MQKENPTYYAVIPANVRYDKRLTDFEKLLYGEITVLTNKSGYCWATNNYFSELYEKTEKTISRSVTNLANCGYITTTINFDGVKRTRQICLGGIDKNVQGGIDKNVPYNNTSTNTTSIINSGKTSFPVSANLKIPKAAKVVIKKPFNLEEEIKEMESIPGSEMDHLASYIWYKDLKVESMGELVVLKKRFGKILKDLAVYSRPRVQEAMIKLNKKADHEENTKGENNVVEWTLETCLKTLQK